MDRSAASHYLALAGLHGCMCQYSSAVDDLAQLHDLGRDRKRKLKRTGYLELNLHRDGNEYCEITECDCDDPEVHNAY